MCSVHAASGRPIAERALADFAVVKQVSFLSFLFSPNVKSHAGRGGGGGGGGGGGLSTLRRRCGEAPECVAGGQLVALVATGGADVDADLYATNVLNDKCM